MRSLFLTAALAAVVAVPFGSTPATQQVAHADPANSGSFGPFLLALEGLRDGATEQQNAAIDAALAAYESSTAANVTAELKLIAKMLKGLDKAFKGNETYQTAADSFVILHYTLRVGPLGPQANLAALSGGVGAVVSTSKAVLAKLKALNLVKDGVTGDALDYQKNRAKFRAKELAYAKFCEGVIRRYGN